jgi:hypothetical protein
MCVDVLGPCWLEVEARERHVKVLSDCMHSLLG